MSRRATDFEAKPTHMSCTPPLDPPGLAANVRHDLLTEAVSQAVRGWGPEVRGGELGFGYFSILDELTRTEGLARAEELVDEFVDAIVAAVEALP